MKLSNVIAGLAVGAAALYGARLALVPEHSLLRPPGAQGEHDFLSRCVKCGKCIVACPYQALYPAREGLAIGSPTLDARNQACRLCEDFPCVGVCPTNALREVVYRGDVRIGTAVIEKEVCIAFLGMRCEVCYRACPLIDSAISIEHHLRKGDVTHALFIPVIHESNCVGCGLCVERCVVSDPYVPIRIEPTKNPTE